MRILGVLAAVLFGMFTIVVVCLLFTLESDANFWAVVLIGGKGAWELLKYVLSKR